MNKVLVTGGSGWLGQYAVCALVNMGYEVHATYHRSTPPQLPCTWHQANLLNDVEAAALIQSVKPHYLLHLAWEAVPPACYHSLRNYDWVRSSMTLIQRFVEHSGQHICVAGTCAEYEWVEGRLSEYTSGLSYRNPYSACKNVLRLWLESYAEQAQVSMSWGRIFHLYGPHESGNRLVSNLIHSLLNNEEARCTLGQQYRDFLYVQDAAEALVELFRSGVKGIVNIGSGEPIQVAHIAKCTGEKLGSPHLIKLGAIPMSGNEPDSFQADITRLRVEVGWKPAFSFDQGLNETIRWWRVRN